MEFLRRDVKTFKGIDSKVIGRKKLEGTFVSPFLCIRMVHAFFHSVGIIPDDQTC